MPFSKFVVLYLETTIINLAIPFKLGEIARILMFGVFTKSFSIGFLSILTDRFFDTLSLLLILVALSVAGFGGINLVTVALFAFIVIVSAVYISFQSTYVYLNRYIIMNKTSPRAMKTLGVLETMSKWHSYIKSLIAGRILPMMLFSLLGWICEGFALLILSKITCDIFGVREFGNYISSIFSVDENALLIKYSAYTIVALGIICLLIIFVMSVAGIKNANVEKED